SHHAHCSALLRLGRFEESIPSCERAIQISPRDSRTPVFNGLIATNLFMLGRYDAAATRARLSVAANGKIPFFSLVLAAALQQTGHDAEAREVVADVRSRHPEFHTDQIVRLWPSAQPDFVAGRQRIVDTVRALGMP
ncbi:MAG: tetratricopeptide repeat protein, partial [Burkholderiaceae bacterium]